MATPQTLADSSVGRSRSRRVRFLVYDLGRGGRWSLVKQVAYRADPGLRIGEVAGYARDSLLVMEAAFDPVNGNSISRYALSELDHAPDVSARPRSPGC
jgi:hypothetical protein